MPDSFVSIVFVVLIVFLFGIVVGGYQMMPVR